VPRNMLALAVLAPLGSGVSACERTHHRATTQQSAILFSGNWETGDRSQWSFSQCANTGPVGVPNIVRGTINVVTDVVAQGKYAARFELPPGEPATACEVLRSRSEGIGTDDWYALEVRFPSNWQEPSWWGLLLAQLDFEN